MWISLLMRCKVQWRSPIAPSRPTFDLIWWRWSKIGLVPGPGPCEPNPCLNGGSCTVRGAGFQCRCTGTYTGTTCSTNHCDPNPCLNGGACRLSGADFACVCPGTYSGKTCSTNHCEPNPCQRGGACSLSGADFKCRCPGTYTGKTCETNYS